jgi:hypothetical protein
VLIDERPVQVRKGHVDLRNDSRAIQAHLLLLALCTLHGYELRLADQGRLRQE